jgi:hypothetical protein
VSESVEAFLSLDIEADGPIPGEYSMLSLGAVLVGPNVETTDGFYVEMRPISERFNQDALAVSGLKRERLTVSGVPPQIAMWDFSRWLRTIDGRPG